MWYLKFGVLCLVRLFLHVKRQTRLYNGSLWYIIKIFVSIKFRWAFGAYQRHQINVDSSKHTPSDFSTERGRWETDSTSYHAKSSSHCVVMREYSRWLDKTIFCAMPKIFHKGFLLSKFLQHNQVTTISWNILPRKWLHSFAIMRQASSFVRLSCGFVIK